MSPECTMTHWGLYDFLTVKNSKKENANRSNFFSRFIKIIIAKLALKKKCCDIFCLLLDNGPYTNGKIEA